MSNPIALEGEVEITPTSKVLKRSISVSNTHHDTVFVYREDVFPNETPILVQYTPIRVPILVQYTPIRQDVGHYECIIAKSPSHRDGGKLESMPAPPPHSKGWLHRPLTAKCACTAPSQQSVPAPPPHSKVCLHRPLRAKCACTAPSQQSVPAPPTHSKVCMHHPLTVKRHLIHVCKLVGCLNSPLRSKKQGQRK